MTDPKLPGDPTGTDTRRDLRHVTEWYFDTTLETLKAAISDIEAGQHGPARDMAGLLSSLRKAMEYALNERTKFDRDTGSDGAGFDLDAARDEIGRRLDRLRATSGARDISGGAE